MSTKWISQRQLILTSTLAPIVILGILVTVPTKGTLAEPDSIALLSQESASLNRDARIQAISRLSKLASQSDDLKRRVWETANVDRLQMKFIHILAGEFMIGPDMGSPVFFDGKLEPANSHRVRITSDFFMLSTEVTVHQFAQFFPDYAPNKAYAPFDDSPALGITWEQAADFCNRLSLQEDAKYRLPTEAEWEYACRAGTQTAYSFGDDASKLSEYAWWDKPGEPAARVGSLKPNAWGLYDMHGNALEWVTDWFQSDTYHYRAARETLVQNPSGPPTGYGHVSRGCFWPVGNAEAFQSAKRCSGSGPNRSLIRKLVGDTSAGVHDAQGFRIVREAPSTLRN